MVLNFSNDYSEGAHPLVLQRLLETNLEKAPGYGFDKYCESAKAKIRQVCQCPEAEIYFLSGGTQTNATVIDGILSSYEGVIAAETGHISVHEAGAIEASGHKVLTLPNQNGKILPHDLDEYLQTFYNDENHDHMVSPGMVYLSHPTEYGTLYTADELRAIHTICSTYDLPLYLDGARLGYGLMADGTDVTLPLIAECCDIFYIGGTKVGALCGEAVVITRPGMIPHFFTIIKQHGALMAKGRLLGVQFDTLFTDDLYFNISRHAVKMAEKMKIGLQQKKFSFFIDSPTNQQFVVLENNIMRKLSEKVVFSFWEKIDQEHTVVRFATSWATTTKEVDALLQLL